MKIVKGNLNGDMVKVRGIITKADLRWMADNIDGGFEIGIDPRLDGIPLDHLPNVIWFEKRSDKELFIDRYS